MLPRKDRDGVVRVRHRPTQIKTAPLEYDTTPMRSGQHRSVPIHAGQLISARRVWVRRLRGRRPLTSQVQSTPICRHKNPSLGQHDERLFCSNTQLSLIRSKVNLSFGWVKSRNPPLDLDLCARVQRRRNRPPVKREDHARGTRLEPARASTWETLRIEDSETEGCTRHRKTDARP